MKRISFFVGAATFCVGIFTFGVGCSTDSKGGSNPGGGETPPIVTEPPENQPTEPGGGGGGTTPVCDPVKQTGCSGGTSKCGVVADGVAHTAAFACQAPGATANQAACTAPTTTGDDCVAANVCVGSKCHRMCDTANGNTDCPVGQVCGAMAQFQGGPPNGVNTYICAVPQDTCDPLLQDCANMAQGCYPSTLGERCYTAGAITEGSSCTSANACVKGTACVSLGAGTKCHKICNPTQGGTPACTTGTCEAVENESYGYCTL
jgi:hypothetical protein